MNLDDFLCDMAEIGDTEAVRYALDHGADVHVNDDWALGGASYNGYTETIKLLLDHGADVHAGYDFALRWASGNGHAETVKVLLDHGANQEVLK
jgi:ankyrin repeat protein